MSDLSPSVTTKEVDYTFSIPAVSTSAGGFAGSFQWGPVEEFRTVTNPSELVTVFGEPNDATAVSYFTAENFLQYSSNLTVVRVVGVTAKNAVATGIGVLIKNQDDYAANYSTNDASHGTFAAKYAGIMGNGLRVSICDNANYFKTLTGTLTSTTSSATVTGVGTNFTTETSVGSVLRDSTGTAIGRVATIGSATSLTLTANAAVAVTGGTVSTEWEFMSLFATAPGTSAYTAGVGGSNDEVHVVVQDTLGNFSSAPGTVVSKYAYLSVATDAVSADGTSSYYKNVINRTDPYVWHMSHPTAGTNWGTTAAGKTFASLTGAPAVTLANGVTDDTLTDAMATRGFNMFANKEVVTVNLIPVGGVSTAVANTVISNVAEVRKDCIAFVSPKLSDVVGNVGLEAKSIVTTRNSLPGSTYAVMDSGWKYQYDRFNDVYRWIPLNGDVAGLCARVDATNNTWEAPAGYVKGQIKNVVKLAYNPSKADRDTLFPLGINPVITQKGQGTFLFGDKTLSARPGQFDAIGTRRLFIMMEDAIGEAAKYKLFEQNNATTRTSFLSGVNPFLRTIKGAGGINDFKAICDSTNNTADVVNNKRFVASIFVKPTGAIRWIELQFTAVPEGVSFSEVVR